MPRRFILLILAGILAACATPGAGEPNPSAAGSPAARALPDGDADISGQITQIDGNRVLIEEQPGAHGGNKLWLTLTDATRVLQRDHSDLHDLTPGDLATGQRVAAWAAGPIAESYPGQGTAEAILVLETAAAATPEAGGLPDRDPDVTGTITQQEGGRVLIEKQPGTMEGDKYWLTVRESTPIRADVGGVLEARSVSDLRVGQRVAAWVEGAVAMSYPAQGAAGAIVILAETP